MKRGMILLAALVLSACSGAGSKQYYQLPIEPAVSRAVTQTAAQTHQLWVQPVNVADLLGGMGVVYQQSDVQFVTASNNLWASPLSQQLTQSLVAGLGAAMPGWLVSTQPLGMSQDSLTVNINAFYGRYDGKVVVAGEWLLTHQGVLTQRAFHIVLPQQGDGYDALVRTLGQAWQQEIAAMAGQIARAG
ncbi:membrane integrity-associated transporter subunit PqiC [Edwardsiella tarda]|uniref:membrane integrity-associated transporter subunit PqiC n=1 Tax=Edwardsiella tarda TaxID=636 RepID=UPI00351C60FC